MRIFKSPGCILLFSLSFIAFLNSACQKKILGLGDKTAEIKPKAGPAKSDVLFYLTQADQIALFKKQNTTLLFSELSNKFPDIGIDESNYYQTIEGFGFTLTGGSASLINSLNSTVKNQLLKELFLTDSSHIGVSYLRISVGASDLSMTPFTYDDIPSGAADPDLKYFTIDRERSDLIPLLRQIISLYPQIKIMASPWTAPVWMKTNKSFVGGKLKPEYYNIYSKYLVKYIRAMKAEGIDIDALTPQNEPLHDGNNPSMLMLSSEQADFIKNHLGPAFEKAAIKTKIIIYDHNADKPEYPISILDDPQAKKFIEGSAFHLYAGNVGNLSTIHRAHPDKGIYFTEQWVGGPENFAGDLSWHVNNLIIGAVRNWSRNVLEWNLASDPNYLPHTDGGCTNCLGAITIANPDSVKRNVAYYIIAHASKFVRPGSVRIESNNLATLQNVAFKTPEGKKVLIVINSGNSAQKFNITHNGKSVTPELPAGAVGTFIW